MENNKYLLVAATYTEIAALVRDSRLICSSTDVYSLREDLKLLITGVGQYNTLAAILQYFHRFGVPREVINIGICGSLSIDLPPESMVCIETDFPASQLAEEKGVWKTWKDAGIPSSNHQGYTPDQPQWLSHINFKRCRGITTDFLTDDAATIQKRLQFFNAQTESMEGAAVFFITDKFKIPAVQIRCVSNYVGDRNRKNWKIKESTEQLYNFCNGELKLLLK